MLRTLCLTPLLAALLFGSLTEAEAAGSRPAPPHPVLEVEYHRYRAMEQADIARLEELLSPDLVYNHSNGHTENREEFLALLSSGNLVYESIRADQVLVRDRGRFAVVTGRLRIKAKNFNRATDTKIIYTAVYERNGRDWRLLSWQSTPAPSRP